MCFGCGNGEDDEQEQPRQMVAVNQQPKSNQMEVYPKTERNIEDVEDAALSASQQRTIKAFRDFTDNAAEGPLGPRMEHLYQQYRAAVRAGGLALEEEPSSDQLSYPFVLAFFQRQVERCQEAYHLLEQAYQSCVMEAELFQEMEGGGAIANAIMGYAAILPAMKQIMEGAIVDQTKVRDNVQADMDRIARGEKPLGPHKD